MPSSLQERNFRTICSLFIFATIFFALQFAWEQCRDSAIEKLIIDRATVVPAAWAVNQLWPDAPASAQKNSLISAHGRLNILNGCEGLETLFLLIAAFVAYPLPWRVRISGIVLSTVLVYGLNQARIIFLWWAIHANPTLFGLLHGTVLPLALIAISLLFFIAFLPPRQIDK